MFSNTNLRNAILFLPVIALLPIIGCNPANSIRKIECKVTKILYGKPSVAIGAKNNWIFNYQTGEFYAYDSFTEKLRLPQKDEEENGWIYNIKSAKTNGKWKKEEVGTFLADGSKAKIYIEIDLERMHLKYSKFIYRFREWERTWSVGGVCKWKNLTTTEIL